MGNGPWIMCLICIGKKATKCMIMQGSHVLHSRQALGSHLIVTANQGKVIDQTLFK